MPRTCTANPVADKLPNSHSGLISEPETCGSECDRDGRGSFLYSYSISNAARLFICLVAFLFLLPTAMADRLPDVLHAGFSAYQKNDGKTAMKAWLKGSVLERSQRGILQLNEQVDRIDRLCGRYRNYVHLYTQNLSDTVRIFFLQMNYDDCPLFSRFMVFKKESGWVVTQLKLETNPEKVLPGFILER